MKLPVKLMRVVLVAFLALSILFQIYLQIKIGATLYPLRRKTGHHGLITRSGSRLLKR